MTGGTLNLSKALVAGEFDFQGQAATVNVAENGFVNFNYTGALITDASAATFNCGANSIALFPQGFDPYTDLAGYSNPDGVTHIGGTTFTVPVGESYQLFGEISDHVHIEGTVTKGSFDPVDGRTEQDELILSKGIQVVEGGLFDVDEPNSSFIHINNTVSGISGGQLLARYEYIGDTDHGVFTQTGGLHDAVTIYVGCGEDFSGTYVMEGGHLDANVVVGNGGYGLFRQSGGTVNMGSLKIATEGYGRYEISGDSELDVLSDLEVTDGPDWSGEFVQIGGLVTVHGSLRVGAYSGYHAGGSIGKYVLHAGELSTNASVVGDSYAGEGVFRHYGGTHNVLGVLEIGANSDRTGIYELSNSGVLNAIEVRVGRIGTGTFLQTGGTATISDTLILAKEADSSGRYELDGGSLEVELLNVGRKSTGVFIHTGGTNNVNDTLLLGEYTSGDGTYDLSQTGELHVEELDIRAQGKFMQSGGTNTVKYLTGEAAGRYELTGGDLAITRKVDYQGDFDFAGTASTLAIPSGIVDISNVSFLNAGSATLALGSDTLLIEPVGYNPSALFGTYTHVGFSHTQGQTLVVPQARQVVGWGSIEGQIEVHGKIDASDGWLDILGQVNLGSTADGVYMGSGALTLTNQASGMEAGNLNCREINVGIDGSQVGSFNQAGGNVAVTESLNLQYGAYEIHSGQLQADNVALSPEGQFLQYNGTVNLLGNLDVGDGQYELHNGSLTANEVTMQDGGHFTLEGGQLSATNQAIYGGGTEFVHNGGLNIVTGTLTVRDSSWNPGATYRLSGGNLEVGTLEIGGDSNGGLLSVTNSAAELYVADTLYIGRYAMFEAVPDTVIRMTGSAFENQCRYPDRLEGLGNVEMVFEGGDEDIDSFEVSGKDLGAVIDGWIDNYALYALTLGGRDVGQIQLVNQYTNHTDWSGGAAVYSRILNIGPDSYLDLNGYNLYYLAADIDPSATIIYDGGSLVEVQVPGDANCDGFVGADDLVVILTNWGLSGMSREEGDLTGEGFVGADDYVEVLTHWSAGSPPPEAVPEPASLSLLAIGCLAFTARRRCRERALKP